ncbi:molybdopterin molybdotransferase MoeA [Muriicola soli]|uniref:Molybdopterin molybdenumtransferase n=1 Tax=Muriicola soli TaxID=2507538 RepID=A0A411E9F1_9FLAO|nr:molybdopterin molybdotransferase MoeA [Muriicola soli]QBA64173.1 molybdopterin molybdenumtransferase MoeA [Muriicola soli]
MISYQEALQLVLDQSRSFGSEKIPLTEALNRILAEDVLADRDFPPFNRSTKDGIAIAYEAVENGRLSFEIAGTLPAGEPTIPFVEANSCVEIMTGAVVPYETDTVVMYEEVEIKGGIATITKIPTKGQNIHSKGRDQQRGDMVVQKNCVITAAEIGVLATVGKSEVLVEKLPKVAVISTGNELVEVEELPLLHQIRTSNSHSLIGMLRELRIKPLRLHIPDDIDLLRQKLDYVIDSMDILILSGGVSKGKFDFLPQVFKELGVDSIFHRVAQRPGKPFWFGTKEESSCLVFSFPGNPVSTFFNFHLYFLPWFYRSAGIKNTPVRVKLAEAHENFGNLTIFKGVELRLEEGCLWASSADNSGSGDLVYLTRISGFIILEPHEKPYKKDSLVPFIATKRILGV